MISFKPAVVCLVLSAFALSQCSAAEGSIRARRLSYALIAGYEPKSLVSDPNAIDQDVADMHKQLKEGAWSEAHHIYKDGAHSKMYANLTLTVPLDKEVPIDTKVTGKSQSGGTTVGRTLKEAKVGSKFLEVQYHVHDSQKHVDCQVGALWRIHTAILDGCFHESGGKIEIADVGKYEYTYDIRMNNNAGRTLRVLSTSADSDMMRCDGCPYPTIEKFYDYYGTARYGDEFVTAAFESKSTNFQNGNVDFSQATDDDSRIQAIKKGTISMNIYMAVIRKMEDAISECENGSSRPKTLSWDEAVALYTGSKEGKDGKATGELLHELADERCVNFDTCGSNANKTSGHAKVNHEIFQQFKDGQRSLLQGNCSVARENKDLIENRMVIPMIQGTLRYAHINSNPETASEKAAAEGTTYATAVLPIVHACNPKAAAAIHENMNIGASTSFSHVKNAFQETYKCLGVTCEDIGGYYDSANDVYFEGAEPCTGSGSSVSKKAVAIAVVLSIGFVGIVAAAVFVVRRRRMAEATPAKKNPVFVTPEEPFT